MCVELGVGYSSLMPQFCRERRDPVGDPTGGAQPGRTGRALRAQNDLGGV